MVCKLDKKGKCHLSSGDQNVRHFQVGAVRRAMPSADTGVGGWELQRLLTGDVLIKSQCFTIDMFHGFEQLFKHKNAQFRILHHVQTQDCN